MSCRKVIVDRRPRNHSEPGQRSLNQGGLLAVRGGSQDGSRSTVNLDGRALEVLEPGNVILRTALSGLGNGPPRIVGPDLQS